MGENQDFYKKKKTNPIFCNMRGTVFEMLSNYLSCYKFDASLFNLVIHPVVYSYATRKIVSFVASKADIFIFRFNKGNACIAITYISEHCHIKKTANM